MVTNYLKKIFKSKTNKHQVLLDFNSPRHNGLFDVNIGIDAYRKNVIVYRCVNLIAQSASHVPWLVMKHNSTEIAKNHPIYSLLKKPNPEKAGADFFSEIIASKLLFGNAYILSTSPHNLPPREIYLLHSPATEIIFDHNIPIAYKYNSVNGSKLYPIDKISRVSKVLHLKNYNPINQHYGLSCLDAASMPIELHLHATHWNSSLLKNGARPSGALIVKDSNGYLSDEQFERLQNQLIDKFTGSSNSGRPLLLEGGLDWQEMSINPKDMDFIESKNSAAREIALAFGVPPQLLGIQGDNTYSNMQEARLALWEETLIPLLDKLSDSLGNWLSYWYQDEILIDFDRDSISALTEKRENLWAKISNSNFMTLNEKREFVGLPPIEDGDRII
jgi:HK97 family phage portal protein